MRALLVSGLLLSAPALAQQYALTPLGTVPGAHSTVATGLNDRGEVVGWSQFFGANPGVRAWYWSAATGFVVLPPAPGMAHYRAIDINNEGVIAGDGAYDSGYVWRYENGAYTVLGALPGDGRSIAAAINESGEIAGTSWGFQFAIPKKAVLGVPGQPLVSLLDHAEGTAINEPGQVAGWTTATGFFGAFRYTPASGVQYLPPLVGNTNHYPAGINNSGDVVGRASHANGNGGVPFLYTDAGGMQELGNFGGGASAAGINDHREVIGNYSPSGGGQPWIWSQAAGLRFFFSLVDLGLGYSPYTAVRINNRGQVLLRTYSSAQFAFVPAIATPVDPPQPGFAYCFGQGCPCGDERLAGCRNSTGTGGRLEGAGSASVVANDLGLEARGLPPGGFGIVFAGQGAAQATIGDGRLCVGGVLVRFPTRPVDGGGVLVEPLGAAALVGAASGDTWRFQCWYRDAVGCTGAGYSATSAYEVTFLP